MNKARTLMSGAFVVAAVTSALAFSPKADNYCLYRLNGAECARVSILESFSSLNPGGTEGLRPFSNCPSAIPASECTKNIAGEVVD